MLAHLTHQSKTSAIKVIRGEAILDEILGGAFRVVPIEAYEIVRSGLVPLVKVGKDLAILNEVHPGQMDDIQRLGWGNIFDEVDLQLSAGVEGVYQLLRLDVGSPTGFGVIELLGQFAALEASPGCIAGVSTPGRHGK